VKQPDTATGHRDHTDGRCRVGAAFRASGAVRGGNGRKTARRQEEGGLPPSRLGQKTVVGISNKKDGAGGKMTDFLPPAAWVAARPDRDGRRRNRPRDVCMEGVAGQFQGATPRNL